MNDKLANSVISKVGRRFVPFLTLCYMIASIDRVNISFAAPTMSQDLALSAYVYGWAAGIFFVSYTLLEIPSNLILSKVGARRWIARIMVTWGILSALTAFVTGPTSLVIIRFLLGAAEAGFFPGIIFFLAQWIPNEYRGRTTAIFFLAVPLSNGLGAIISAPFLAMDGILGLHGWQWLFIVEGIPASLLGIAVLFYLVDSPKDAKWLNEEEKGWLISRMEKEHQPHQHTHASFRRAATDKRVLGLSAIWLLRTICLYGVTFFLPQMVTKGHSAWFVAIAVAAPSTIGAFVTIAWAHSSDRHNERRLHIAIAFGAIVLGFVGAAFNAGLIFTFACLTLAAIGYSAITPCLWAIPPTFLTGAAAAGGIALINAIGYFGGLIGPVMMGWAKDIYGSFEGGLYMLALLALAGGILTLVVIPKDEHTGRNRSKRESPQDTPALTPTGDAVRA